MNSTAVPSIESIVLEEVIKRIAKKIVSGKKLNDSEVMILILDQVNRRIEAIESRFDGRFKKLESISEDRSKELETRFEDRIKSLEKSIASLKDYVNGRLNEMSRRIDDLNKNSKC